MGFFTLILLLIIAYWVVRSLKGLFTNAFGDSTNGGQDTSAFNPFANRRNNPFSQRNSKPNSNANNAQTNRSGAQSDRYDDSMDQPIGKDEGEYVDFEEVKE